MIQQAEALRGRIRQYAREDFNADYGEAAKAQVCEFFRCTAPGSLDTLLRYAAGRSSYVSRASIGVWYPELDELGDGRAHVVEVLKDTTRRSLAP